MTRLGQKRWRKVVRETIDQLTAALEPEYVVLGGGNAEDLGALPPNVRLGSNEDAFLGGFRLWVVGPAAAPWRAQAPPHQPPLDESFEGTQ